MSSSAKREAGEAFEEPENANPHLAKRKRTRKHKHSVQDSHVESEPATIHKKRRRGKRQSIQDGHGETDSTKRNEHERNNGHALPVTSSSRPLEERIERPTNKTEAMAEEQSLVPLDAEGHRATKRHVNSVAKAQSVMHSTKRKQESNNRWNMSHGSGGIFIRQDPLLTGDGKSVVLPTASEIQIYSTSTSLLVRSLSIGVAEDIVSCVLSGSGQILVATAAGKISRWDLSTGRKLQQWSIPEGVVQISSVHTDQDTEQALTVHCTHADGRSTVMLHALSITDPNDIKPRVLLRPDQRPSAVQVLAEGAVIVVAAGSKLFVGFSPNTNNPVSASHDGHTWREVSIPEPIVSMDARLQVRQTKPDKNVPVLDLVVGSEIGAILIYQDILLKFSAKEKRVDSEDIVARRLHWHRTKVNTVKWSKDGNYVISGGDETVLVIWQLDTNQKQCLPHLSTSIESLSVSVSNSAYALRLGNNSVIVLSTADLLPTANICGLLVPHSRGQQGPIALHPGNSSRLLAAVPSQYNTSHDTSATLLQTFDVEANMQIYRQALTRNTTTVVNVGPGGQRIKEPSVTHLAVSHDGRWLCTVDEWSPDSQDHEALYLAKGDESLAQRRTETSLKFWEWAEDGTSWTLVTRVDEPHRPSQQAVLGLQAHPSKLEVSTVGSDGTLKTWSPKARLRDGVGVKGNAGQQLFTWTSSHTVQCERSSSDASKTSSLAAAMAYSEDGSVLAASWSRPAVKHRFTHFVDSRRGKLCASVPDIALPGPASFAFSGRYLLALSQNFCIWDTVSSQITFSITLAPWVGPSAGRSLTTNAVDGTFVLAVQSADIDGPGQLAVFSLEQPEQGPMYERSTSGQVKAVLARVDAPGYIVVDAQSRIRHLQGPGVRRVPSSKESILSAEMRKGLDGIFGPVQPVQATSSAPKMLQGASTAGEHRRLEDLFGAHSSSQAPAVGDLFHQVASLLSARQVVV